MKNKIVAGIVIVLLVLYSVQVVLNFAPIAMSTPDSSRKEVWQVVNVTNTLPYNTIVDVNVTLNSRKGVYIACSNNVTEYFTNSTYWPIYPTYWDWLNGTSTQMYHWGEMDWYVSNGSLTPISYSDIQFWGPMYQDSGGGVNYTTFMGNTYMADWNLTSPNNQPDIIYQAYWQGNTIKMIDDLFVPASNTTSIVFKIVLTEVGSYTFNITTTPGVTVTPSTWTVGGVATILVPYDYSTIQAAINAASAGDTVIAAAGTYTESQILIDKPIKVLGSGPDTTIIDGSSAALSAVGLVRITANAGSVTFSNFTVKNAGAAGGVRVGIYASSNASGWTYKISNNIILGTNNSADSEDYGFYTNGGKESLVFTNNSISLTGANPVLIEQHTGSTEISLNNLDAGVYGSDSIFFMTYGGMDVLTLQNVSYNTFNMGTGAGFDYDHRATGVSFCSVYPALGSGPEANFTNMVISGNTFNNLESNRRGIGFWNAGTGENLVSPLIIGNTINGDNQPTGSYGIDFYGLTTNATITGNTINSTETAIALRSGNAPGTRIRYNNIMSNAVGINWTIGTTTVDASYNWFGNETGPAHSTNPAGTGNNVTDNVSFEPWLIKPYPPLAPIAVVYVNPQLTLLEAPALSTLFTVNVTIANVTMMYGFQFTLKWNSALINLTNPTAADKIPAIWGSNYIRQYSYSIAGGNYTLFESARSPAPPLNGTTTVASLTFRSIYDPPYPNNVSSSLALENVTISDPTLPVPKPILRLVYNGNYTCITGKPKLLFTSKEYSFKSVPNEFDAVINITHVVNLHNFTIEVKCNSTLLTVLTASTPFPQPFYIGVLEDTVYVNANLTTYRNGTMTLATIRFKVENGFVWNTQVRLINSSINFTINVFNEGAIVVEPINGTYLYRPVPGDLDMDGVVTIIDLSAVAKTFGTSKGDSGWDAIAFCDLNKDDTINILDIVIVARNFGREEPEL